MNINTEVITHVNCNFSDNEYNSLVTTYGIVKELTNLDSADGVFVSLETGECFDTKELGRMLGILSALRDSHSWQFKSDNATVPAKVEAEEEAEIDARPNYEILRDEYIDAIMWNDEKQYYECHCPPDKRCGDCMLACIQCGGYADVNKLRANIEDLASSNLMDYEIEQYCFNESLYHFDD